MKKSLRKKLPDYIATNGNAGQGMEEENETK